MNRRATQDPAVVAQWGVVPVGDVVVQVALGDELVARVDIYRHQVTVDDEVIPVAWFDHGWVNETYRGLGIWKGLFAAAMIGAAREAEWGALFSHEPEAFAPYGFFSPPKVTDHLLVVPLVGQPRNAWPQGRIDAVPPLVPPLEEGFDETFTEVG